MRKERLKTQDLLDYLEKYPGLSENEIQVGLWGIKRDTYWGSIRRYITLLRRALRSSKIKRIKIKDKSLFNRYIYRYCLASQSFDVIFKQIEN